MKFVNYQNTFFNVHSSFVILVSFITYINKIMGIKIILGYVLWHCFMDVKLGDENYMKCEHNWENNQSINRWSYIFKRKRNQSLEIDSGFFLVFFSKCNYHLHELWSRFPTSSNKMIHYSMLSNFINISTRIGFCSFWKRQKNQKNQSFFGLMFEHLQRLIHSSCRGDYHIS